MKDDPLFGDRNTIGRAISEEAAALNLCLPDVSHGLMSLQDIYIYIHVCIYVYILFLFFYGFFLFLRAKKKSFDVRRGLTH